MNAQDSALQKTLSGGKHNLQIRMMNPGEVLRREGTDIGIVSINRPLFGKNVPYCRLYLGQKMKPIDVPTARMGPALKLIKGSFSADRGEQESFQQWAQRCDIPFFSELLQDLLFVAPQDLSVLMADTAQTPEQTEVEQEKVVQQLQQQIIEERQKFIRHIDVEQYRDALDFATNALRLSGNALLSQYGVNPQHDVARIGDMLASRISGNRSISAQYDVVRTSLEAARRSLRRQDVNQVQVKLDSWLDRVDWIREKSQAAVQRIAEADRVFDLSTEQMSQALIAVARKLEDMPQGQHLKLRVRAGRHACFVASGMRSRGYEVLIHAPEDGGKNVILVVEKEVRRELPAAEAG